MVMRVIKKVWGLLWMVPALAGIFLFMICLALGKGPKVTSILLKEWTDATKRVIKRIT